MPEILEHKNRISLYIHFPFCLRRCSYCAFYSTTDLAKTEAYLQGAQRALEYFAAALPAGTVIPTVYFGGGTPSAAGKRLCGFMKRIKSLLPLTEDCEVTLEANPKTVDIDTMAAFREAGFNRISIGIQSLDDPVLKTLGRMHTAQEARQAVDDARKAGFSNISVDIMLATPGQNAASARELAEGAAKLRPDHISAYLLKIEPGTAFEKNSIGSLCPDEDLSADIYAQVCDTLAKEGFVHYEISNFARPGFESRHNNVYWELGPYIGIGPGAHSFIPDEELLRRLTGKTLTNRTFFPEDLDAFIAADDPFSLMESESQGGTAEEYVMLGLRLKKGISLKKAESLGVDMKKFAAAAKTFSAHGLAAMSGDSFALTEKGMLLSNSIISELL